MSKEDNSFTPAELQVIERTAIAYEKALLDMPADQIQIEFLRAYALVKAKERPLMFLEELRRKASLYVERTKINE